MERHTEIPIAGNTESHKNYNKLLNKIAKHKKYGIPILDELCAAAARVAAELMKSSNNVVPMMGKCTGAGGSIQGLEQPQAKSHKACAQSKSHKACAQAKSHKACAQEKSHKACAQARPVKPHKACALAYIRYCLARNSIRWIKNHG